jgi:hypothetical protein
LKHPKVEEQSLTSLKERMIAPNIIFLQPSSPYNYKLSRWGGNCLELITCYEVLEVSECGFEDDDFFWIIWRWWIWINKHILFVFKLILIRIICSFFIEFKSKYILRATKPPENLGNLVYFSWNPFKDNCQKEEDDAFTVTVETQ